MAEERDLGAMAREIVDANLFMTLATADSDGRPWASPVYFSPADYREFFWISEPGARHSRNIAARPEVSIVFFDSQVLPGGARAVYVDALAVELTDDPGFERGVELYNARFPDPENHNLGHSPAGATDLGAQLQRPGLVPGQSTDRAAGGVFLRRTGGDGAHRRHPDTDI